MELYFFRHALAEDAVGMISDFDRKLTPEGINRTRQAAQILKSLEVSPTRLYSSPLVRARQTAELLSAELGIPVQLRSELAPGFGYGELRTLVHDASANDHIMLVGHEPDFSVTISALTGGSEIVMKKGGLARIEVTGYQPLQGALVWLIAPKVFQALG